MKHQRITLLLIAIFVFSCDNSLSNDSTEIKVTGIDFEKNEITINENETVELIANITPENSTNQSINWVSLDDSIAKASEDGEITGISEGKTEIICSTVDGGYTDNCTVNVVEPIAGVTLDKDYLEINEGSTEQLNASLDDSLSGSLYWESEDEDIATVSDHGVVTAISPGETWIVVSTEDEMFSDKCEIVVKDILTRDELRNMIMEEEDVKNVDTSNITDMSYLFFIRGGETFNQDISGWDVSNVTTMEGMFWVTSSFNQDISNWDTSSVQNMSNMFGGRDQLTGVYYGAESFNQDISDWDVSNVVDMSEMFAAASAFNNGGEPLDWSDTSNVIDMSLMFHYADSFNQDVSSWDVSNVQNMQAMFDQSVSFNNGGVALDWSNTSNVINMRCMFHGATSFNQDISMWNVSSVEDMSHMFSGYQNSQGEYPSAAEAFNQDISSWNVSNVTDMTSMFLGANSFNQDISEWSQHVSEDIAHRTFSGIPDTNITGGNNECPLLTNYHPYQSWDNN